MVGRACAVGAAVLALVAGAAPGAGAASGAEAGSGAVARGRAAEAELSFHGAAVLADGRLDVRFLSRNHGPAAVPDATVRLRWSAPLEDRLALPGGCVRAERRAVLCRVGPLPAGGPGVQVRLRVGLRGAPSEVLMEFTAVWSGGTADRGRDDERRRVLVLDTGDTYYF
ncbi:hypothetical protein [Streptomyces glaucescens]|uniref:Putative secreted protein n=1 Tax=Streptomyces glaucescens TaxID=1907 RepID=A0A089Z1V3_STRGA|nr:hypothetical protein [Streptomyces glaucescens]AIR99810.1 putative secreted protein [Streptomyces glaucescens]